MSSATRNENERVEDLSELDPVVGLSLDFSNTLIMNKSGLG